MMDENPDDLLALRTSKPESTMDDLVAFLTARLDEDEQATRDATWHEDAGAWRANPTPYETRGAALRWYIEDSLDDGVVSHVDPQASDAEGVARHIARHHPARVLRDIEAKQRILNLARDVAHVEEESGSRRTILNHGRNAALQDALEALALPYADHPDYQEEWKP